MSLSRSTAIVILAVILIGGASTAYYVYIYKDGSAQTNVQRYTVEPTNIMQSVQLSGNTKAIESADLGFQNAGTIGTVNVSVGETVQVGQSLMILRSGSLTDQLAQAQAQYDAQNASLANLQAGTRPQEIAVTQSQISGDGSSLQDAQSSLLNALQSAQSAADSAVNTTIDAFITNPQGNAPQLLIPYTDDQLAVDVLNERSNLQNQVSAWPGRVNSLSASDQSDLLSASSDMHSYVASIDTLLQNFAQLMSGDGASYQTQLGAIETARADLESADGALTGAVQKVDDANSALSVDQNQLALQQAGNTKDTIATQQATVVQAQAQIAQIESELKDQSITAPFSGIVSDIPKQLGESVAAGETAISIVSTSTPEIEAYLPEIHYTQVALNDPVEITLDAFPGQTFSGVVSTIYPVAEQVNGVPNFKIDIQFDQPEPSIKPGITANVTITSAQASSVLIVPIAAVTTQGSTGYVTKVIASGTQQVPVTLGIQSAAGDVEVTSGLSAGDTVLIDTTQEYRIVPN